MSQRIGGPSPTPSAPEPEPNQALAKNLSAAGQKMSDEIREFLKNPYLADKGPALQALADAIISVNDPSQKASNIMREN